MHHVARRRKMEKTLISGYISLKSILEAKSREVYEVVLDKDRYDKVQASNFHVNEKRQYERIQHSGVSIRFVSEEEFNNLGVGTTSGGIAAYVGERRFRDLDRELNESNKYYTILDGIEDPFNYGYAIRSLYASGVDVLIIPKRNFFNASEIIVRASAGASELIKCCVADSLEDACRKMKDKGISLIATAKTEEAKDINRIKIRAPLCIIYGGERRGISAGVLSLCDQTAKIKYPRNCHYSLPAVSAVSIISFEIGNKLSDNRPKKK